MQYGDKLNLSTKNQIEQNGITKQTKSDPITDAWQSVWIDPQNIASRLYPLRYMLEAKFDKSYKCPCHRSAFCQCPCKMTRTNWVHHMRRGHTRIDYEWRRVLKRPRQNGISGIFQVFCVLCNKSRKGIPVSPHEFIAHMRKVHPQYLTYTDYFAYFQRCYICNDETKSFQQNIQHRQMCVTAVSKEPNQVGTGSFNNCFKTLYGKTIVSVELDTDPNKSFEVRLKSFTYFKRTTLHYWLTRRKTEPRQVEALPLSGNGHQETHPPKLISALNQPTKQFVHISQFAPPNPLSNSVIMESERIPPGKVSDIHVNNEKFFIPVPFPLRNDIKVKEAYTGWSKLLTPRHSKITKINPWYCELCNGMIRNIQLAYSHLKMCHSSVRMADNQCKSCNKRFLTVQGYQIHFQEFKLCPVARKCGICGLAVPVSDIYNHLFDMHKNNFGKVLQLSTCLICRDSITDVGQHLFDIHNMPDMLQMQKGVGSINYRNGSFFNCIKCSLTFFSEIDLRNHMITAKHYFECAKCPTLKFYSFWHLNNHRKTCHKKDLAERNLACEMCSNAKSKENEDDQCDEVRFCSASEKVDHFIKEHRSDCFVVLTKMEV